VGPVQRGIFLAPFDDVADPGLIAELSVRAEARGWDGFFLWDHVNYHEPVRALLDPWVTMAAMACATSRLRLGPLVTPLSRRRVQKVARETVTLDRLSGGRLTLGVGLGVERNRELEPWGEVVDARERAVLLDAALARLGELWSGEFEPVPVQRPRIPVWVAARWPNRRPLRRAARWDGLFPIGLPDADALRTFVAELGEMRSAAGMGERFDVVAEIAPGGDPAPWAQAGATWVLTGFDHQPRADDVRAVIEAGP
jgi:alkanesulfonate monooxygenase SsuD/methylene tetrahydromethanopterin reductase-like flavin-dependent oxidoreductase (luciferase family)